MKNSKLTTTFAIYSLVALLIIGFITGLVLARQISDELYEKHIATALEKKRTSLDHELTADDFKPGSKNLAQPAFSKFMTDFFVGKDIRIVQIWGKDGTILYSNTKKKIGTKPKHGDDLEIALSGKNHVGFETLPIGPKSEQQFLELYSPIRIKNKIVGAYEAYISIEPVTKSLRKLYVTLAVLLSSGLALLWLILNGLVRQASKTITTQNDGLQKMTDELTSSLGELQNNYLGTMESLASAVEARDPGTRSHSDRLEIIAVSLSKKLDLDSEQQLHVQYASALHDIGKIGIPEAILMKPGPLNPKEWRIMKTHALIGAEIIEKIPFLKDLTPVVKHHHECFEGTGYPDGLVGDQIPIESRILSVVDAFDAMTSDRPYRKALSTEEAVANIMEAKGTQFDPKVVDAFLSLMEERPNIFTGRKAA